MFHRERVLLNLCMGILVGKAVIVGAESLNLLLKNRGGFC
jgi:hypothetical protein